MTGNFASPKPSEEKRARTYERDTDTLFLKLLRGRPDVVQILASETLGRRLDQIPTVQGQVRHEGASGSIDLVVDFPDGPVLLVENKIDAAYSINREGLGQPQRYRASVAARSKTGREVHSVLLAPARYIASSRLAEMFGARVTYEAFMVVLGGSDLALLQAAILQAQTPYEPIANVPSGDFFAATRIFMAERFPDLLMKHDPNPGGVRPDSSRTVYFDVARTLRTHPEVPRPRMSLQCWDSAARSASVKIMLPNRASFATSLVVPVSLADIGGYMRPAGRSLGIVIDTPRLDTQRSLTEQADDVEEALQAALRLQSWWNGNGDVVRQWVRQ